MSPHLTLDSPALTFIVGTWRLGAHRDGGGGGQGQQGVLGGVRRTREEEEEEKDGDHMAARPSVQSRQTG